LQKHLSLWFTFRLAIHLVLARQVNRSQLLEQKVRFIQSSQTDIQAFWNDKTDAAASSSWKQRVVASRETFKTGSQSNEL
jgi:hypothetical protein